MRHWIHQWYENNVMAKSWGRFGLAAFVSDTLYYILFASTPMAKFLRVFLLLMVVTAGWVAFYILR